ncbi:hypothetical protein [Novosphingobium sp. ST904]|uniref:hypothetical protein n=1 Tax=Novosphingobium sp. ST904 TaxID=1684385 RepID=UPI0006C85949|nr:hypothetical protein [Novosphingobium sp. ST904]KPH62317.1 hypothetical protein ADT71_15370 [Novosphingobium sp. ST904]
MLLIYLAAVTADVDACAKAVHSNLPGAEAACDSSGVKIDLFDSKSMSDACLSALKSGAEAGKYGPNLPIAARNGLIREFDKKLEACRTPSQGPKTPVRETTKLWD